MTTKLTQAYDGHQKPMCDRPGVYQRNYATSNRPDWSYCLWDGHTWYCYGDTRESAARNYRRSNFQDLPWRGLTKRRGA